MGSLFTRALPPGSTRGATFNIASATLGAGALALPYAFKCSGVLLGGILLTTAALATVYSIQLLLTASRVASDKCRFIVDSYEDLASTIFGKGMRHLVEALMILFCFGTAVAYCIAVGDILEPVRVLSWMPDVLRGENGRSIVMLAFWGILMLPLSLLREVSSLQFSSFLGVANIVFLVFSTVLHCVINRFMIGWDCHGTLYPDDKCTQPFAAAKFDEGMLTSLPLIMFAFTCQVNVYDIYRELRKPSEAKMMRISWIGMLGICLIVYATIGIFGYLDFIDIVQGNILINLQYDVGRNAVITCAFGAITMTIVSAFPLVVFPCRESIFSIFRAPESSKERDRMIEQYRSGIPEMVKRYVVGPGARLTTSVMHSPPRNPAEVPAPPVPHDVSYEPELELELELDEPLLPHTHLLPSLVLPALDVGAENYYVPPVPTRVYTRPPAWQHYIVSLGISVGAISVAIFIPSIQVVFSLLGGICSSFLCFVFPAMCVIRLDCCTAETFGRHGVLAIHLMKWGGIVAGVLSTAYTIYTTFFA